MAASVSRPSTVSASHIPALDGLRGIAILLVVVHHFALYGGFGSGRGLDRIAGVLAGAGWAGVDLFFVLSGFLITRILLTADRDRRYFRDFYARRTLRIFPIYYATLVFCFLVWPATGVMNTNPVPDQAWYWTYLLNVRIATDGWPEANYLAHFWSLAVEEQFYLLWPLIVYHLRRESLLRLCLILILSSLALRVLLALDDELLAAYVLTPARMDALATGALLALLATSRSGLQPARRWAWRVAAASAAVLAIIALARRGLWTDDVVTITLGLTLLAALSGALIVLAVTSPASSMLAQALSSRPLSALGRYSYGLYVLHHPIAIGLASQLTIDELPVLFDSRVPALLLYILVGGGLSLAAAMISWHGLESRFLGLKDRFRGHAGSDVATVIVRAQRP